MPIGPWFSPDGGVEAAFVWLIGGSVGDIDVMAWQYQSGPIQDAMLYSLSQGSNIRLILDKRQQRVADPLVDQLRDAGCLVRWDKKHQAMRETCAILQYAYALIGSYVMTERAEHNWPCSAYLVENWDQMTAYMAYFETHWQHSVED